MTPIPLAELRLRPSHHRAALWWLGLLYRRPERFAESVRSGKRGRFSSTVLLIIHASPWIFLITFQINLAEYHDILALSKPNFNSVVPILKRTFYMVVFIFAVFTLFGAFGKVVLYASLISAAEIVGMFSAGFAGGLAIGIDYRTEFAKGIEALNCITLGIFLGTVFGVAFEMTDGILFGVGFIIAGLRVYYLLINLVFVWPRVRGKFYRWHPLAWDDMCSLPFPALDRLLVAYSETDPAAASIEIERLIDHYPSQRMQALKARAILIARSTQSEPVLSRLDLSVAALPEGEKGFLREVPELKQKIAAIAQQQRRLDLVQIPAFREPLAAQLVSSIENFRATVAGLRYPLNSAFREAAFAWLEVAKHQQSEVSQLLSTTAITQVFRAGDPVDCTQEAFVPRLGAIEDLQSQLTLATGCPGLLLYGRRRMGKSTLLRNLQPFLPTSIRVASSSMQDPRASTSLTAWIQRITRVAIGQDSKLPDSLSSFFDELTRFNQELDAKKQKVIIAIDEYENIDTKIGEDIFTTDLLDTLRESIQMHRRIIWLFSGSHALAELNHAEWSSYFVSLRTVELGPFSEAETRLLLTEPLHHSDLWPKGDPARPHFDATFWEEDGIERIHAETAGWPHLVQLIAERAVYLVNLRGLRTCTPEILDEAIDSAVTSGDAVLRQLVRDDCRLDGEWNYLKAFRTRDTQPPPEDEALYQSLRRRLMVVDEGGLWRMRVPLMQRWLRERG